jgi:hypothetical protein
MLGVSLVFGVPLLIAGAMIDPQGLHPGGLITYAAVMLALMPIGGWLLFASQLVMPTAGRSRLGAVIGLWLGGTLTAVAAIFWIYTVLGYPAPGAAIDPSGHLLVPFMPRAGLAIGLFAICMLVSCGVWGAASSILRPQVAVQGALITGCALFVIVYGGGYILLIS